MLTDLAGKSSDTREKVIDSIIQEQFVELLPEEARVWVKERKPNSSQEAGRLDFRQARKESWETATGKGRQCYSCKPVGHLARDCPLLKPESRKSHCGPGDSEQKLKSIVCFSCKTRGHVAKICPRAMLC